MSNRLYLGLRLLSVQMQKGSVCVCTLTSVVYGAGNHLHGIPPHPSARDESASYSNML